jgi:hypothetical protein
MGINGFTRGLADAVSKLNPEFHKNFPPGQNQRRLPPVVWLGNVLPLIQ